MSGDKKTLSLSPVLLGDIETAMNDNGYEMEWYLDVQEEKATFLCDPALTGEYEANEKLEQQIEQDREDRFIPIPGTTSREGWEQMERFILSLEDQDKKTHNLLLNTIQGRGAFGRFKDAVYSIGLQDRWHEFKNKEDRKAVLDWLRSEDLITDLQVEEGMQMYEEQLRRRKQREKEVADMIQGTQVRCTQTSGHADKLTFGSIYDVLDEQEQQKNIRIRDDRGKICWLPKSHFELVD